MAATRKMSGTGKQLALRNDRAYSSNASRARAHRLARWQATFLKALRHNPNVTAACRASGVSRFTAYKHREDNDTFAAKWEDALNESVDKVEAKVFQQAIEGDPQLSMFILKAHRPQIYRERIEAAVAGGIVFIPAKQSGPE